MEKPGILSRRWGFGFAAHFIVLVVFLFVMAPGSLDFAGVGEAHAYNSGTAPTDNEVHQWITQRAVQYLLQREGGVARQYREVLTGRFMDFLKMGVWKADNTNLSCVWEVPFRADERHDCDAIHHYGQYGVIETNDGIDAANPGELTAQVYADGLYELALKFWPGGDYPRLEELRYVDAGQTMSTGLDIDPTDLMRTYIGGLPNCERYYFNIYYLEFLRYYCGNYWQYCAPFLHSLAASDASTRARNQCPVWPPGIALDSEGKQTMESVEFAMEYLGWALHMIQDLTVPYHALNRATSSHSHWENSISDLVRRGSFDHLPLEGYHSCYAGPPPYDQDLIYITIQKLSA